MKNKTSDLFLIVPKVVSNYIGKFPETYHNAYQYFNYDNRVVDESVERHDTKRMYRNPNDFSNDDYETLIKYAKTLINPELVKYSPRVACEDALHTAIRDFSKGVFDNKINANKFNVLLDTMVASLKPGINTSTPMISLNVEAKKEPETKEIKPHVLKQLGIKKRDVPVKQRIKQKQYKNIPHLYREKGKTIIRKESQKFNPLKEDSMLKNAKEYTERLDKIAEEVQKVSPEAALQIDMVSDVLDGRRDASTLQYEADEARYMANRFDYRVRSREADEPYMDEYNRSNYEQMMREKKNPQPVRKLANAPYQKKNVNQ